MMPWCLPSFHRLQLETNFIDDASPALHAIMSLTAEGIGKQPAFLRQRMVRRGADFSQVKPVVAPCHKMAGAGDFDLRFVLAAPDNPGLMGLEQFRVKRASVELENQLGDFRSNG